MTSSEIVPPAYIAKLSRIVIQLESFNIFYNTFLIGLPLIMYLNRSNRAIETIKEIPAFAVYIPSLVIACLILYFYYKLLKDSKVQGGMFAFKVYVILNLLGFIHPIFSFAAFILLMINLYRLYDAVLAPHGYDMGLLGPVLRK